MPADPELLRSVPFFQTLDDDERRAVAGLMHGVRFAAGTVIFHEHDLGGVFYVIQGGGVELSILDEHREKVVVDVLKPGEFFGELSLLDGGGRSTTATALADVEAFSLERDAFLELLKRRSDLALDLLTAVARRLRKTDELLRQRVRNPNEVVQERETFADRVADGVARFGGSWRFIFSFGAFLVLWMVSNSVVILLRRASGEPLDPFPFILLNLFLSTLAAIQAPVIMMSQNRQDTKDRIRSELDYQVNLKAELEIMQLHDKVDALERRLTARLDGLGRRPGS